MALILDTGPIVALLDAADPEHERCVAMVDDVHEDLVVPAAVLVEVDYWLRTLYGPRTWQTFVEDIANGAYRLETVIPGLYPGRTEHIHVKVTVSGKTYTSQLFFPGVSQNASDSIYSAQMLIRLNTTTSPVTGTFTFVVPVS